MTALRPRPACWPLLLLASLVATITPLRSTAALLFEDCRLERDGLPAAFAECATLRVPEQPDDPDSAPLDLFVARVPAATATPEPDPLVLINGGPGGSAVDLYLQGRGAFEPARRDRAIVLLDQRGTGRSLSGLTCETPEDLELETATPEALRTAVENCIAEFPRDASLFTTSIAVRDLDALRAELGLQSWNIYGVSYGTRVAQHYLRRYPEHVRAMILDGTVPATLPLGPDIAPAAQSALDRLLDRCSAEPACSGKFGDIRRKFAELSRRFEGDSIEVAIADPVTGEPEIIDVGETHLHAVVRLMSYADTTAALLPLVIDAAHKGNFEPLAAQADLLIQSVSESLGFAMHNSVVCTEDVPLFPEPVLLDPEPYLGTSIVDSLTAICETWPTGLLDPDFSEPLVSHRPVLLLSGELDPVTPPAYAERVIAEGLDNSIHLIGTGKGHGIASIGCTPRLIRNFLQTPEPTELDTQCLEVEGPTPFFLNFQGPAP